MLSATEICAVMLKDMEMWLDHTVLGCCQTPLAEAIDTPMASLYNWKDGIVCSISLLTSRRYSMSWGGG